MIEVSVVYSDEKQIEKVREFSNGSLTFNFIDITTKKGKKEGWALKNYFAAKLDPFAVVYKGDKPIKAFYSEAENTIDSLLSYLQSHNLISNEDINTK